MLRVLAIVVVPFLKDLKMKKLLFDFVVQLQNHELSSPLNHNGPLFHKWLPDGESDAIILDTDDPSAEFKVSFKRFGFVDESGYIRFEWNVNKIDPTVIPRQAVLEGGFMVGWLSLEMSDEEVDALRASQTGYPSMEALAKRIIKLIYLPLGKLITLLRTHYGQYWLRELSKWDSRNQSLGSYCAGLGVRWSVDGGKSWSTFIPNERIAFGAKWNIVIPRDETFKRELLTRDDWFALADEVNSDYYPALAPLLISRAYQLCDEGHLRQSFIEGVTALEVALDEHIKQKRAAYAAIAGYVMQFQALPLPAKVATVATLSGTVSSNDVEATIAAYKIRNDIVHDGMNPSEDDESKLLALLRTAASLIGGPKFRFLKFHTQNALDAKT
jgi:hypothetical protein